MTITLIRVAAVTVNAVIVAAMSPGSLVAGLFPWLRSGMDGLNKRIDGPASRLRAAGNEASGIKSSLRACTRLESPPPPAQTIGRAAST